MLPALLLLTLGRLSLVKGDLAQTAATCTSEYAWMGTSKGASPCQVAASLNALCYNGNWNIPALNASVHYNNPSTKDGTASWCTCSWASYNAISACTACQGYPEQVAFWSVYTVDCTGLTSDTYWPTKITISTDITIPYWASRDPTKWTNQKFNSAEAKNWTSYADLNPSSASASPSSSPQPTPPVGAIVGAVIGGLVVIVGFIMIVIWITRRHHQQLASGGVVANGDSRLEHIRKISDTTVNSGLGSLTSGTLLVQRSGSGVAQMHNNYTSSSSLPFFQSPQRTFTSPARRESRSPPRPEEVITPYMLPPTNESPDKKQSNGEWPMFDPPNAPPQNSVRMEVFPSQTPTRRARYNPPAYSESDPASPVSRHHGQESIDSNFSTPDTSSQGSTMHIRPTHTPANSGSSLGHMPISSPLRTSMGTVYTSLSTRHTSIGGFSSQQGHGRSLGTRRSGSRELRRQTQDSISPSDIA